MTGFSGSVRSATNSHPEKEPIMSYTHLTEKERYVISHLKLEKFSLWIPGVMDTRGQVLKYKFLLKSDFSRPDPSRV
jgi:hypothetical protein